MSRYTREQLQLLAGQMRQAKEDKRPFALLTGAGCSISAGIPSAEGEY